MLLYLHGFASGPDSAKGRAFAERFACEGVETCRADLTPGPDGFERSTPLTMLAEAERALAASGALAVMGSSLGGYLAAVLASRHAEVERLVLLAPAFRLFERWSRRLTPAQIADWKSHGLETDHHATGTRRRIDWAFLEEAGRLPAFPEVRVPTLCIAGRRDELVPLPDIEAFVERTPSARLVVVEDGHDLLASVDRIFSEAREFLRPVVGGGAARP
jgi:pimeloyl-ACP methyl ester carboxylesterase